MSENQKSAVIGHYIEDSRVVGVDALGNPIHEARIALHTGHGIGAWSGASQVQAIRRTCEALSEELRGAPFMPEPAACAPPAPEGYITPSRLKNSVCRRVRELMYGAHERDIQEVIDFVSEHFVLSTRLGGRSLKDAVAAGTFWPEERHDGGGPG